jgi:hypothetical protein
MYEFSSEIFWLRIKTAASVRSAGRGNIAVTRLYTGYFFELALLLLIFNL